MTDEIITKQIPLTQGKCAIVDATDYEWLVEWKWSLVESNRCHTSYARRYLRGSKRNHAKYATMHREIMNTPKGMQTDHINGNGLDNRRCNLRVVTQSQNQMNAKKTIMAASKHKGGSWHKVSRKWQARIQVNKKRLGLGFFDLEAAAATAYNNKAIELYGEFANLNIIGDGE